MLYSIYEQQKTVTPDTVGMSNMDAFRVYSGATFALLYDEFPLQRDLDPMMIVDHCQLASDPGVRQRHLRLVEATWTWLIETGYLRRDPDTGAFALTPRSFEGLTFINGADGQVCRGEKLTRLAKKIGSATALETVAEIVSQIIGTGARTAFAIVN